MKWFNDALTNIYQPYDVRGLYNQHRLLVLDGGLYDDIMEKLNELKEIHCVSPLDLDTIDGIIEDIEADRDNLNHIQNHVEEKKQRFEREPYGEEVINLFDKQITKMQSRQETFDTGDDGVSIYIDPDHVVDVLARVEKEAISQVLKMGMNRTQTATALGISYRTLTNKIQRYFKNVKITD